MRRRAGAPTATTNLKRQLTPLHRSVWSVSRDWKPLLWANEAVECIGKLLGFRTCFPSIRSAGSCKITVAYSYDGTCSLLIFGVLWDSSEESWRIQSVTLSQRSRGRAENASSSALVTTNPATLSTRRTSPHPLFFLIARSNPSALTPPQCATERTCKPSRCLEIDNSARPLLETRQDLMSSSRSDVRREATQAKPESPRSMNLGEALEDADSPWK